MKHMQSARCAYSLYFNLMFIPTLIMLISSCASPNQKTVEARSPESYIRLGSIDNDVAGFTMSVVYDWTGGQLRTAIEQGKKEVTLDPSKIPSNPMPLLISARLNAECPSGIYRGNEKIGTIDYVCTGPPGWDLFMQVTLDKPIYYRYDELSRIKPGGPHPCGFGLYFFPRVLKEGDRWGVSGTLNFCIDPDLNFFRPAFSDDGIKLLRDLLGYPVTP